MKKVYFFIGMLLCSMGVWGQTTTRFNDGYLTVLKVTSGAVLANTGTAVVAEEYLPTGAAQGSSNFIASLPSSGTTLGANDIVIAGTSTSAGSMSRSENGRYLLFPGYKALIGALNATFTTNGAIRTLNGGGTLGAGLNAGGTLWLSGNNGLRGATSDDGTNYWITGSTIGIQTSTNGTTITTVSATSLNNRVIKIFNGELYFSTGSGTNGIYKVGTGKPITTGHTSILVVGPTGPTSFSFSPDGLTCYALILGSIVKYTFSGGVWSAQSVIATYAGGNGLAVNYTNYIFSTSAANGAIIYACNPTTLVSAPDNGTSTLTLTTLRTEPVSANNAFRSLSFSPINQTVSLGVNTPATGNIVQNTSDAVLFQFNLAANEGNSTIKKVIVAQTGTATIGAGNSITNFRLIDDANNNGIAEAGEIAASLATGSVAGSNITFSSITLASFIAEASNKNFLVIGDVAASATPGNTFIPSIVSDKTLNSVNYTTNLVNASGSWVTIGATAPTGNTLTINAAAGLTPPTLIAAVGATVDADFNITYVDDATWRGLVTTVKYGAATLTAGTDYTFAPGILTLKPTGGNPALHVAGTQTVAVSATGYNDATVSQPIGFGAATKLGIVVQPTSPATNGAVLATQPTIAVQDQYGNAVTTSTAAITAAVSAGAWTIGGTTNQNAVGGTGIATYTNLTATSAVSVTGATIDFTSAGLTHIESNPFNIHAPPALYTWIGVGTGSWATAANWTPTDVPITGDAVQFIGALPVTVTDVPAISLTGFNVTGIGAVTLQAAGAVTVNVGGGSSPQFNVGSGASVLLDGTSPISINVLTANTGSISGTFTSQGGAHRLTSPDASGITFNSGAIFNAGTGFAGSAFGTVTANSVVFANGSTYTHIAGSNPFSLGAPSSVVVFNTGSLFKLLSALTPSVSGRIYANFELDAPALVVSVTGATALTLDNLTITNGTFNMGMNGGVNLKGNISVAAGAILNFAPAAAAALNFNGTTAQSISNLGTLSFSANQNVNINNATGVTLNSPITISGALTLTSGIITTTATNLLTMAAVSSVTGASNASFVNGPVSKIGNTDFIFPVGKPNCGPTSTVNGYVPIGISNFAAGAITDQYTAEYIRSSGSALPGGVTAPGLIKVSACEYWKLDKVSGTQPVDVRLYWNAAINNCTTSSAYIDNLPDLVVAHHNGISWDTYGATLTATGSAASGDVTWPGATIFSPFTIGSVGFTNPLPISINYFTGTKNTGNHLLNWKLTCVSSPSAGIDLERSVDGRNYNSIYSVYATALRCQQPFNYTDNAPAKGVNYYRLKMTDANGKITYSTVVSLIHAVKGIDVMNIAPNPIVNGAFNLNVSAAAKTQMDLVITDMQGRVMQKQTVQLIAGFTAIPVTVQNLAAGTYQLVGNTADGRTRVLRFVIQ